MAKEWTDEEVQAEIAAAVAIVREDRFEGFVRGLLGKPNDSSDNGSDPKSPPRGNPVEGATNPKKRSLWWGDLSESSK